jgi:sugar/nucleoside kinase (ribokinase family)/fructoselysine-6-P-deglycase FrlB-like protein
VSDAPRVIVAGNVTLDDVVHPDGSTSMAAVGGNSLYSGLGARLWTPHAGVVTRLGEDVVEAGRRELARAGLADGTTTIPGPAVRYWVLYEADGGRRYVHRTPPERYLEVALSPDDIPDSWLTAEPAPVVHIAAMPLAAAEALVERVRERTPRATITLDTHEDWGHDGRARLLHLSGRVDCFMPSREELADILGYDDPPRAIGELAARDGAPRVLVVKLGVEGCLVWQRGWSDATHVEPVPAGVVDVTGAGDAFCGGLAAGLAVGLDPVEAARRGAVSASFAIEGFGSLRLAEVTPEQARARLLAAPPAARGVAISSNGRGDPRSIRIMLGEIDGIPTLLERQLVELEQPVDDAAAALDGLDEILLVGCGDSYFAGRAAELAFESCAGVRATAVHAMEFARYRVRYLQGRAGVVPISYSGRVGRTVEAAVQARRFGHATTALTGRADGPLAQACERSLVLDVPSLGFSPGTNTFAGMVLALLQLAAALGERRGRDTTALRAALHRLPTAARDTLAAAAEPARAIAHRLASAPWLCFIGAGPSEASARFGAAKLFEGAQMLGTWTNLEEWAHEEYFVSGRGSPVVVVAPAGASRDRAAEILAELDFIGADAIVVSDAPGAQLPFAAGLPEHVSPLLAALPLSLLGFFLADARGKRSYNFPSTEAEREHYDTIHRVTIGEPA